MLVFVAILFPAISMGGLLCFGNLGPICLLEWFSIWHPVQGTASDAE